MSLNSGALCNQ